MKNYHQEVWRARFVIENKKWKILQKQSNTSVKFVKKISRTIVAWKIISILFTILWNNINATFGKRFLNFIPDKLHMWNKYFTKIRSTTINVTHVESHFYKKETWRCTYWLCCFTLTFRILHFKILSKKFFTLQNVKFFYILKQQTHCSIGQIC